MSERKYTQGEEICNAISHTMGVMFSIYAIVTFAVASKNPMQAACTAIFGAMMFILFQASACYHAITNETAKKVFQKIDHSAIYLLIAGTYTPILMITVPFPNNVALLSMIWYLALLGIVFSCISLKSKFIATALYLLMGWLSLFLFYYVWSSSHMAIYYLLGGGILYSVGAVFYLLKYKYMHTIWHFFVLGGVILHYLSVLELLK